jgi:hypothetical protein
MGIFAIFKRRRNGPSADERRAALLRSGRLTEGTIIDAELTPDGDEIVFFVYTINGVDYESSERLTDEQRRDPLSYAPGAKVGVRFETKNHGNAIIV